MTMYVGLTKFWPENRVWSILAGKSGFGRFCPKKLGLTPKNCVWLILTEKLVFDRKDWFWLILTEQTGFDRGKLVLVDFGRENWF